MAASLIMAATERNYRQRRITFIPALGSDTDSENDHPDDCHCIDCRSLGKAPIPCHCLDCHDHDYEHPNCRCHCPYCHECEEEECGCHCDFCHKCKACTEDCQCFYCYEETGVCLDCDEDCDFCQHGGHDHYCGCEYCTRRRIADGTFMGELMPSAIKSEHESVYTQQPYPCSAIKHSPRHFYDRCTSKELRGFVRARGLRDPYPGGLTLKYSYVCILEAADRSPTVFRFLDLPPEVRTLIYEELLSLNALDPHNRPAKIRTQILQTCQFLCREATDVLYSNSPALCLISADESLCEAGDITYRAVRVHHYKEEAWHGQPIAYESLWPAFLTRIRHIRLSIRLHDWTFEAGHEPELGDYDMPEFYIGLRFVKTALKRLSMLLADTNDLKKLEVSFEVHPKPEASVEGAYVRQIMSPLRRLRQLKTFTLVGDVPEDLSDSISQDVTSTD